ncbi:hypothetical protein [Raoultella sp. BIGb0138]|uniref:hypothetical protein n=1 Tax=Raoultella sp. BIGb0138 TaxID=2485115 RepID=UPI00104D0CAF|nr:hypothetical protein [Raoultella sp. BIGb0138]
MSSSLVTGEGTPCGVMRFFIQPVIRAGLITVDHCLHGKAFPGKFVRLTFDGSEEISLATPFAGAAAGANPVSLYFAAPLVSAPIINMLFSV